MAKFTFKRGEKAKGLARIGAPHAHVEVRLGGKQMGTIFPPNYPNADAGWRVSIFVKREPTKEEPCTWKHAMLKFRAETEEEVRKFLTDNCDAIVAKFDLHFMVD